MHVQKNNEVGDNRTRVPFACKYVKMSTNRHTTENEEKTSVATEYPFSYSVATVKAKHKLIAVDSSMGM